jgi:hypothetical protein
MKSSFFSLPILCLTAAVFIAGCSKNNGSPTTATPVDANVAAVQSLAIHSDSTNAFNQSDSVTIDDQGAQSPDYDNSGTAKVIPSSDSIAYGRKMFWSKTVRTYSVKVIGDTAAVVTVTRSVPAVFIVIDFTANDTTYSKSFTEALKRSFYFKRIARRASADSNWVPVAVSIGYGYAKPDSTVGFKISSIEFTGDYDTTASDPLNTWFWLGHPLRSGIPFVQVGDSVRINVWVSSTDSTPEVVHLRHGVAPLAAGSMRVRMNLVSQTSVTGGFTRVYSKAFAVHDFAVGHPLDFLRRYSAFVDVISHASIWNSSAPFENEYWAFPYIAYK